MNIDKAKAKKILQREAIRDSNGEESPSTWVKAIEKLSDMCEGSSKTHIAFLGTALLAKATNSAADAFSVKTGDGKQGRYSARSLGHGVLVPSAPVLGIHLGVTGREPLNNQPYFRIQRATETDFFPPGKKALVRGHAEASVRYMVKLLAKLDQLDESEAQAALRAFIHVRRQYTPSYKTALTEAETDLSTLVDAVEALCEESEGGKRAQAAAGGILAAAFDPELVECGAINDPDRHLAGDVGLRAEAGDDDQFSLVFEVRDKPVTAKDILLFGRKCAETGNDRAGVIAVAEKQKDIDTSDQVDWCETKGVTLVTFFSWRDYITQCLFWSSHPSQETLAAVYKCVRDKLIELECSGDAVEAWDEWFADD